MATYRDLGSFQLLLSLQDNDALRLFCDSILGPIETGEGALRRRADALAGGVHRGQRAVGAAARRLYCHRHTLRYRIRKVEELTGRDLARARDRIEFWLALRGAASYVNPLTTTPKRGCMKVGVPTEIKTDEYRVALTPAGARELADAGHEVFVQSGAGEGSAIGRRRLRGPGRAHPPRRRRGLRRGRHDRQGQGAPAAEVARLEPRHTLFTYLHLAPDPELTRGLAVSGATCIAYETVEDAHGRLPLLAPMSEVAGKIATQAGAFMLEKPLGGRGHPARRRARASRPPR